MTHLMSVDENARRTAVAIKNIFNVDVVIIDEELNRIADTFGYSDKQIIIRSSSIVGMIVRTGKALAIDDKDRFDTCKTCVDRENCTMRSLIGVPIWLNGKTIGAIGLIIPEESVRHLFDNLDYTLDFLNEMAFSLSHKVQSNLALMRLNQEKIKREMLIHCLDKAAALLDDQGLITFSNKCFNKLFFSDKQTVNIPFASVFQGTELMLPFLEEKNVSDFQVTLQIQEEIQIGFCKMEWIEINNQRAGAILLIHLAASEDNIMTSEKTADEIVHDEIQKYLGLNMKKTQIASILGVSRATLYRKLKKKGYQQNDQQQA